MAELPTAGKLVIELRVLEPGQSGNYGLTVRDDRGVTSLMMSGSIRTTLSSLAEFVDELRDQERAAR